MSSKVERSLTYLENRLARASDNLMELAQLHTYRRLTGADGFPPASLSGDTEVKLKPTLKMTKVLWHHLSLIINLIDKAKTLIGATQWLNPDHAAQIDDLLNGKTIDPKFDAVLGDEPIAETPTSFVSAKELLDQMSENFENVKKSIMAVDALWNYLPIALSKAEEDTIDLLHLVAALNEEPPELSVVPGKLQSLRLKIEADPFGVKETLDRDISPVLARLRKELAALELQRNEVRTELKKAHHRFEQLKDTRTRADLANIKSKDKVSDPHGLRDPLPLEAIEDLVDWLSTLESTLGSGRWKAASIGLQRFLLTVDDHLNEELKILRANEAPLVVLAELRGRLSALQSKAEALQKEGKTLPAELQVVAGDAERILYSKPAPLELAEELVIQYATILNSDHTENSYST